MNMEPKFHYFEDCLPEDDVRAYDSLCCQDCKETVHAGNNETMGAWFDTALGAICLKCVYKRYESEWESGAGWSFEKLGYEDTTNKGDTQ